MPNNNFEEITNAYGNNNEGRNNSWIFNNLSPNKSRTKPATNPIRGPFIRNTSRYEKKTGGSRRKSRKTRRR